MPSIPVALMRGKPGGDRAKLEAFAERLRNANSVDLEPSPDQEFAAMVAHREPEAMPIDLDVRIVTSPEEVTPSEVLLIVGADVAFLSNYPGFRQGVVAVLGSWVRSSLPRSSLPALPGFHKVLGRAATVQAIAAELVAAVRSLSLFVGGIIMLPERRQQRAYLAPLIEKPLTRSLAALRARIVDWIGVRDEEWSQRVLAVCGARCSGKTSLLAALAEAGHAWAPGLALRELSRGSSSSQELLVVGAHFFGADQYVDEHTVRAMLFSVGEQLAMAVPGAFEVRAQFTGFRDQENARKWSDDPMLQFLALISRPYIKRHASLPDPPASKRRVVVVVDGLDKCAAEDRPIVLRMFLQHWRQLAPKWLGLVFSCGRDELSGECETFDIDADAAVADLLAGQPAERVANCDGDLLRASLMLRAQSTSGNSSNTLDALVEQRMHETGLDADALRPLVVALCVARTGSLPLRTAHALSSETALDELLPQCSDLLVLQRDNQLRFAHPRLAESALRVLGGDDAEAEGFTALAALCDGATPDAYALQNIVPLLVGAGDLDGLCRRLCSFEWLTENLGPDRLEPVPLGRDLRRHFLRAAAAVPQPSAALLDGVSAARALRLAAQSLSRDPRELAAQATARLPAEHPLRRSMPAQLGYAWVRPVLVTASVMRRHDFPVQREMWPGGHWVIDLTVRGDKVCVSGTTFLTAVLDAHTGRCLYRQPETGGMHPSSCLVSDNKVWTSAGVYEVDGARSGLAGTFELLRGAGKIRESGGFVAVARRDKVCVFDGVTRELLQTLLILPDPSVADERDAEDDGDYGWGYSLSRTNQELAFHGDRVMFACNGRDDLGLVRVWNWRTGELIFAPYEVTTSVSCVVMDAHALAYGMGMADADNKYVFKVMVHDARDFTLITTITVKEGASAMAFNADMLVCGLGNGALRFWRRDDWSVCADYPVGHEQSASNVAFGADFVASSSFAGNVVIWDLPSVDGATSDNAEPEQSAGPDGINEEFAIAGCQADIQVRLTATGELVARIPVSGMAYESDKYGLRAALHGDAVAVFHKRSSVVEVWTVQPLEMQLRLEHKLRGYGRYAVALCDDAVAVMSSRGQLGIWHRSSGAEQHILQATGDEFDEYEGALGVAISARAAVVMIGGCVLVWSRSDGKLRWRKDGVPGRHDRVLFERDGALRVGHQVFNAETGALLRENAKVNMLGNCDNAFGVYGIHTMTRSADRGRETVGCTVDSFVESVMACESAFATSALGGPMSIFAYGA